MSDVTRSIAAALSRILPATRTPVFYVILLALAVHTRPVLASKNYADQLSGIQIQTEIIGSDLVGRRFGIRARILHASDGRTTIQTPIRTREGRWNIVGDELCVTWQGRDEAECVAFVRRTAEGQYRVEPNGINVEAR